MLQQAIYRIAACMMRNHVPDSIPENLNSNGKYSIMDLLLYNDMHICIQHRAIIPRGSPGDTGYEKCELCVCVCFVRSTR